MARVDEAECVNRDGKIRKIEIDEVTAQGTSVKQTDESVGQRAC